MVKSTCESEYLSDFHQTAFFAALLTRNLYSAASIGLEGFLQSRERVKLQISNCDGFKAKMQEFVKDENSKNLVFTEDLKNMLHIAGKEDVELLMQMIERFCSQSKEVRFGNFIFGPVTLRFFHHFKDPDSALALFKNEKLDGFFDQLISYQLLLDLLYESKRYQDVLDTFEIIKSRQVQGARYPKHVLVLAFAACYKLNTAASLEYATKLYHDATTSGHVPMRRGITFFATLALNQNQPFTALEVVANVRQQSYLTIRTIKALALASLKRFDDVVPILRSVLEIDNPMAQKQTFPVDSVEQLKKSFEGNTNKDLQADFVKVVGFLATHGHISELTLDDILCAEIQQTMQVPGGDNFQRNNRDNYGRDREGRDGGGYGRREDFRRRDNNEEYGRRDDRRGMQRRELDYPSGRTRRPGLHELN